LFREYSRCSGFIRKKDRGVTFSLSRFRPLEVTFSLSLDRNAKSDILQVKSMRVCLVARVQRRLLTFCILRPMMNLQDG